MFYCKLLERISRDVISNVLVDVSKDKTLFALLNCPLKVISRDTILDISSSTLLQKLRRLAIDSFADTLTKRAVAIVNCSMMFLAKVGNFCLSRMKGCRSYYVFFHLNLMINGSYSTVYCKINYYST